MCDSYRAGLVRVQHGAHEQTTAAALGDLGQARAFQFPEPASAGVRRGAHHAAEVADGGLQRLASLTVTG
ncbi:hypothetical protein ETD86_51520 [Nonomuraea turkmeniaca]|uniref:Uncharacterized protein n=1 Tax=Nonomuraea turkmeniaca TaxID=103838 RepID=A0A5S4EVL2_9ACTN|nr:hypothetical protein [Nonomuraea turkmeniaca]TMR07573.1 hypothetical protein ETD86_51520 [Nonomuraea turkmeniaca]